MTERTIIHLGIGFAEGELLDGQVSGHNLRWCDSWPHLSISLGSGFRERC